MNEQEQATQLTLFSPQLPHWETLPQEAQQAILDVLSQILLQALVSDPDSNTHPNIADNGNLHDE
jgi:hypothetical protein